MSYTIVRIQFADLLPNDFDPFYHWPKAITLRSVLHYIVCNSVFSFLIRPFKFYCLNLQVYVSVGLNLVRLCSSSSIA